MEMGVWMTPTGGGKKRGLPKQLQEIEDLEAEAEAKRHEFQEFAREMFGSADIPQNEHGLPSLEWIKSQFKTKSAAIRYLVNEGFAIKHIAKHLDLRYQHVRNVAHSELKRGPNEDWRGPLLARQKEQQQQQKEPNNEDSNEDSSDDT